MIQDAIGLHDTGSLVVVGAGISASGQMTLVARNHISQAEIVYALVTDKPTLLFIQQLNKNTHSLSDFYAVGKPRVTTYQQITQRLIESVHQGRRVCAVFYGHPGIFVGPSHDAIEHLKQQGYSVQMEPGISAMDCLFADLGIDPSSLGCQTYEATQFLFRRYSIDPHMTQIIWQAYCVGQCITSVEFDNHAALELLTRRLLEHFDHTHQIIIYEARQSMLFESRIQRLPLGKLPEAELTAFSTLVVPGIGLPDYDFDVLNQLGAELTAT